MSPNIQRLRPQRVAPKSTNPLPVQRLTPRHVYGASQEEDVPDSNIYSVLGEDAEGKYAITLGDVDRRSGLYVLGKPGMGKTTLLVNLALQDIEHGHGVFFLDPHADAIADIIRRLPLERKNDVILLDPENVTHSFCINLLACKDISNLNERQHTYDRAYHIFYKLWGHEWGPLLELILSNTLYAFIENPNFTLADAPLFLRNDAFRDKLVRNIRYNQEVATFWREEFGGLLNQREQREQVRSALTRIRQLLTQPYIKHVIGHTQTTIDFQRIMAERKIVLASLSANLAENVKQFLGTIIMSELIKAARDRVHIPKAQRHQFCVFVDEFQNFVTSEFATFITEARKFSVATTIAHQERFGQLGDFRKILGATLATAHKIIYQPTVQDAEIVAKEYADRPQPAWLEVLKDEWREVLEDEEIERIEDEIEDGLEPVLEPKGDLAAHLLKQGHRDQRVMDFVAKYLEPNQEGRLSLYNKLLYMGMTHPESTGQPLPEEARKVLLPESTFTRVLYDQIDDYSQFDLEQDELEEQRKVGYSDEHKRQAEAMLERLLLGANQTDETRLLPEGRYTSDEDEDREVERSPGPAFTLYATLLSLDTTRRFFADLEAALTAEASEHPDMTAEDFQERIKEYLSQIDPQVLLKPVLAQAFKKARTEYYNANKDRWR